MDPFTDNYKREPLPEGTERFMRVLKSAMRDDDLKVAECAALLRNTSAERRYWQIFYNVKV